MLLGSGPSGTWTKLCMKIQLNFDDFLVGILSVPFLPELGTLGSPS